MTTIYISDAEEKGDYYLEPIEEYILDEEGTGEEYYEHENEQDHKNDEYYDDTYHSYDDDKNYNQNLDEEKDDDKYRVNYFSDCTVYTY